MNKATSSGRLWTTIALVAISLLVLGLAVHRATVTSFSHDESYTYLHYPEASFLDIILHKHAYTNNHLLNTLGMKYAWQWFGDSELSLRLPNLAALALWLVYAIRILRPLWPPLAIGGLLLACANPYMLELFTLARGYGLSFGFFLMAQYHLARSIRGGGMKHLGLFHIASVLAALSNFTLLTPYVAGLGLYYIAPIFIGHGEHGSRSRRSHVQGFAMLAAAFLVLRAPVQQVMANNAFDFGGKGGLFADTVGTWARSFLPGIGVGTGLMLAMQVLISLVVLVPAFILLRQILLKNTAFLREHAVMLVLATVLIGTCIGAELQHWLFGVDRMAGRFAMFLVPSLVVLLPLQLSLLRGTPGKWFALCVLASCVAWCALRFPDHFGPDHSVEWAYDLRTMESMEVLVADHRADGDDGGTVRIGNTWLLEPTINYYARSRGLGWLERADRDGFGPDDDYRMVVRWVEEPGYDEGFVVLASFDVSDVVLLKRASPSGIPSPRARSAAPTAGPVLICRTSGRGWSPDRPWQVFPRSP